jgi:hypothetical protein
MTAAEQVFEQVFIGRSNRLGAGVEADVATRQAACVEPNPKQQVVLAANPADTQPSEMLESIHPELSDEGISASACGRGRVTRPIVIGVCGYCAGQGQVPVDADDLLLGFEECDRCYGHGDLDAVRLIEAYECGRRDALESARLRLAELDAMLGLARGALDGTGAAVTYRQLRARVG